MLAHDITALAHGLAYEGHDFKSKTVASICIAIKEHSSPMFQEVRLYNALRKAHESLGQHLCTQCGQMFDRYQMDECERKGEAPGLCEYCV